MKTLQSPGESMKYNLVSGMVFKGTGKTSELAQRLVDDFCNGGGQCGIVIANASEHCLKQPHRYLYSGSTGSLPMNIPNGTTGLITAAKTRGSPWGTSGIVTYDIDQLPFRLQILWTVPFFTNGEGIKVNVNVGKLCANAELYESMINNFRGELVPARTTTHVYEMKHNFLADVYMGNTRHPPLTVFFRKEEKLELISD